MTFYEHAMLGIDGALAVGLHRRYGWQIVALAGTAAMLPDLDGLTIVCGAQCYSVAHRVWLHNLLVTGVVAALFAAIAYRFELFDRAYSLIGRTKAKAANKISMASAQLRPQPRLAMLAWIVVGVLAAYSHLLADVLFSSGKGLSNWGVPLLWPFSTREFEWPSVSWGDVGVTLIFAAGMFAMVRWPKRLQWIAAITLLLVAAYIVYRGLCPK